MRIQASLPGKSLIVAVLCLALGLTASLYLAQSEPATPTLPLTQAQDSYAIYSLLIPGEVLARMDSSQKQRWAIAATTINAQDINPALAPEAALKPPVKHAKEFQEAVADYNLHKNQRFVLMREFELDRPYTLLNPSEVAEFRAARASPQASSSLQQKYSGYPGITFLSQVYFNSTQTAALVYMLDWCGNLCAQSEWIYLEKRDGHWVRRSGKAMS